MRELIDYNISVLMKIDDLLSQLSDEELSTNFDVLFGSSIGQHFRHILEFYECLLINVDSGTFSYDKRQRNYRIASEVMEARRSTTDILSNIQTMEEDKLLIIESELPGYESLFAHTTSLQRELAYLADHGVHHLAIIRIALEQHYPYIMFPQDTGVAASTLNFRSK
jgi:uncharacterized damage-inducible protein DinB